MCRALDNKGCREWNQDVEDEANWLAGVLLVPEPATIAIAKGRWTKASAAIHFGVSQPLIQMRLTKQAQSGVSSDCAATADLMWVPRYTPPLFGVVTKTCTDGRLSFRQEVASNRGRCSNE
jgi:hypothetical protein